MTINVLVVDDHPVVHHGLKNLFKSTDITVVDEAFNGTEAIEKAKAKNIDVIILDVRMPDMDGLKALEAIQEQTPRKPVIMLSTHDNRAYIAKSAALGAFDYLLKTTEGEKIVSAIKKAAAGSEPDPDSLLVDVRNTMKRRREPRDESMPLTNREVQVLRHVAMGLSNREIGKSLEISIETVKEHVQNILRKIDVSDRTQAAVWAVKKGLV
jgi:DNA-binding NarL/FixJ family response regulator